MEGMLRSAHPPGMCSLPPLPHTTPPLCPADIPNLGALRNPGGVAPAALPLTLRMLCHVPILVSSRRSQTSGSPTHVTAKLWLAPLPAEVAAAAGAAPPATAPPAGGRIGHGAVIGLAENYD